MTNQLLKNSRLKHLWDNKRGLCKQVCEACLATDKYEYYKHLPPAKYGGRQVVTMIPGGGVGPILFRNVLDIVEFMHAPVDFEVIDVTQTPEDIKCATLSILRNKIAIKGQRLLPM